MRTSRLLLVAALVGCATQSTLSPSDNPAELRVEVWSGLAVPAEAPSPPRLHVVLDVTSLAGPSGEVDVSREEQLALARRVAAPLIPAEASEERVVLHPFDRLKAAGSSSCKDPGPARSAWVAGAVEALRDDLTDQPERIARVVLIADLEQECSVDLCRAVDSLGSEAGAWLDVVSLGNTALPACLPRARPSATRPGALVRSLTPEPPGFRVESAGGNGVEPKLLAQGVANGDPVRVPPGIVRVVVGLDRAEPIGPFVLSPGGRTRVRLMSFPASAPGERSWIVESDGAP